MTAVISPVDELTRGHGDESSCIYCLSLEINAKLHPLLSPRPPSSPLWCVCAVICLCSFAGGGWKWNTRRRGGLLPRNSREDCRPQPQQLEVWDAPVVVHRFLTRAWEVFDRQIILFWIPSNWAKARPSVSHALKKCFSNKSYTVRGNQSELLVCAASGFRFMSKKKKDFKNIL